MHESMKVIKYSLLAIAGSAIVAGGLYMGGLLGKRASAEKKTAAGPKADNIHKIDPALVGYREINNFKVDLNKPYAITVDRENSVFLSGDSQLVGYRYGRKIFARKLPEPAKALTACVDGKLYLCLTNRIMVTDKEGNGLATWGKMNEKAILTSIATTGEDVFVADAGNRIVYRFNKSGKLLGKIGARDEEKHIPGFVIPSAYFDLAIGYEGFLWVVNPGLQSLENYTFDGELRSSWRKSSLKIQGFAGCCNPTHMAILPDGAFVTSEKGIPRVKVLEPAGDLRTVVAGPGDFAPGTVGIDLAVDSQGRILVLDPKARLVRIFIRKPQS